MERKKYKYCGYWLDEETRKRLHRLKQMANKDNGPSDRVVTMTEIITNLINREYDKQGNPSR